MDRRRVLCTVAPGAIGVTMGRTTAAHGRPAREFQLAAVPGLALTDTGKPGVPAWTYGGSAGPQLRVRQGERVRVHVSNKLGARPCTGTAYGCRMRWTLFHT